MADKAVAVVSPDAAKARALAIIKQHTEAVSYVRTEDLDTSALFMPVVSYILPTKEDFYDPIPGIGIMAKPPLVNLIAEKSGTNILRTETSKRGEYIWVGHAFGEKRQPDGTMRTGDASYEFDAEKRAELDAINQPGKYNTEIAKRKHLLETAKFGEQRAVTGAQFALIHKMAHVSRSFKTAEELKRGMMVLRIDRNVDGLLQDPAMREAVIAHALGATRTLFGSAAPHELVERDVTPEAVTESPEAPLGGESAGADPFDDEPAQPPLDLARTALEEWASSDLVKAHPRAGPAVTALLAKADATLEEIQSMLAKCKELQDLREKQKAGGGA